MGTYMVRYPLGGNLSWALQYLAGLKALGHDVYMVEKYVHPNSCYDPVRQTVSDDCSYGVQVVNDLLKAYGLEHNWCYVQAGEVYHGRSKKEIEAVFQRADLYIENGAHGAWDEESAHLRRVYIDVDPAFTQIRLYNDIHRGTPLPRFDAYYTNGLNVGRPGNMLPLNGIEWKYIFNPVHSRLFKKTSPPSGAPYSTIMNWKSYSPIKYNGVSYGHKNVEFARFQSLPTLVDVPMEMAVSGLNAQEAELVRENRWRIRSAQEVTFSVDSFREYLYRCRGEFSVCKHMYVATSSGWFSDKSAAFMACGRPVVVQETGFSDHLPTGEGLFGVKDLDEAKAAIETIESDYERHSRAAREIAGEYLESGKVLKGLLSDFGIN
jgi:hypothetical protein